MFKEDRQILLNIFFAFIIKGTALSISFFSFPAYLRFFQDETILGFWFTLLSILSWILTFDFGIGNGLRNLLIKPLYENNILLIKQYISSTYVILGILTLFISVILIPLTFLIDWNIFFNISDLLINKELLRLTLIITLSSILLQLFFKIINSIMYSLQKSAINNFLTLTTSLIQYLFLVLYKTNGNNLDFNLILLSYVHMSSVVGPLVITTLIAFNSKLRYAKPNIFFFDYKVAKKLLKNGGSIFFNQILFLLLTTTNSYIISLFIGPSQVVEYQIYYKIFILSGTLFMLALTPLWSGVSKAYHQKKYNWINNYFNLMLIISLILFISQFFIVYMLQFGFNIWLGTNAPTVNIFYAYSFAIFSGVFIFQSTLSTFAMGFNKLKLQALFYTFSVISKFLILFIFVEIFQTWIFIVITDTIILLPYVFFEFISIKKLIRNKQFK